MRSTTPLRTVSRVIAIALATLFTLAMTTTAHAIAPDFEPGGDFDVCEDGFWAKADWDGDWYWEAGPDWTSPPPPAPTLVIDTWDDNDPLEVTWTSETEVLAVGVKSSTDVSTFDGGTSGTVAGYEGHAISFIVFCYGEPPPDVLLEKAWFADAEDEQYLALFRKGLDGWGYFDGDKTFEQPAGFDMAVTYGEDSYTVTETLPDGWQAIDCPADAPQPNGLGTFPYEKPGDDGEIRQLDNGYPKPEMIRHVVCNAPVPEPPPVPSIGLEKTPDTTLVTYDPVDGDDETVTYTYVITNTGETPLTGITLVDDVLGTITLPATDLAIGATLEVDATHVVTEADATAGEIVNTATTTGTAPDETEVTDTADARVEVQTVEPEVVTNPGISLEKTALVPLDDGLQLVVWNSADPDATTITYEYVITNTGDTALTGVTLVDDVLGTITLPTTDLAVGESITVTAVHTVTAADAEAGQVDNEAVTTGTAPDDTDVSDTADATVLVGQVLAEVLDNEVLAEEEEQLPAAGAASVTLALAAAGGVALGAVLLLSTRRRE